MTVAKSKKALTANSHRIQIPRVQHIRDRTSPENVTGLPDYIQYMDAVLCVLHFTSGCVIVSETGKYSRDIRVNVHSSMEHHSIVVSSFDIMLSISIYFWITAVFHLIYACKFENRWIFNKWVEYGITAGIMIDILGVITGTVYLTNLIMLWALIDTTMIFGYLYEKYNTKCFVYWGCLPFVFAWITLFIQFSFTISKITLPTYGIAMLFIQFVLFSNFALIPLCKTTDVCYILSFKLLSLMSKLLEGWVIFVGVKINFENLD